MTKQNKPTLKKSTRKPTITKSTEEEICAICHDYLNNRTTLKTLTPCGHKFHETCIIQWLNAMQANSHTCPICRGEITVDQWPPPVIQQQQHAQISIPERRLQQVVEYQTELDAPVPFLGIVLCYNNTIYGIDLNTTFGLTTNDTLGDLKTRILVQQDYITGLLPTNFTCAAWNVLSAISRGATRPIIRTIQIRNICFTTPSMCSIPEFISPEFNDDMTLGELYEIYQENAAIFLESREDIPNFFLENREATNYELVSNVYNNHVSQYDRTPDWDGRLVTNFFLDPNNPSIPERFRAVDNAERATHNSIAWLGINIDCVMSGGKPIKKKEKKTKKRKPKFLKKRKSITQLKI